MTWYIDRPASTEGPFTIEEVRSLVRDGKIRRDDRLAQHGTPRWVRADRIVGEAFPKIAISKHFLAIFLISLPSCIAATLMIFSPAMQTELSNSVLKSTYGAASLLAALAVAALVMITKGPAASSTGWRAVQYLGASIGVLGLIFTGAVSRTGWVSAQYVDDHFVHQIQIVQPGVIRITGQIGRLFAHDLERAIKSQPGPTIIEIDSKGGMLESAMAATHLMSAPSITVRIRNECLSACVALFAAAPNRELMPSARIGLHRASDVLSTHGAEVDETAYRQLLIKKGFSTTVMERQKTTPANNMIYLKPTSDVFNLPQFTIVDRFGRYMSSTQAHVYHTADVVRAGNTVGTQHVAEILELIAEGLPDVVALKGYALNEAMQGENPKRVQDQIQSLIDTALLQALASSSVETTRAYWEVLSNRGPTAFIRQDYAACGGGTDEATIALIAGIKLEVFRSAKSRQWRKHEPMLAASGVARFQLHVAERPIVATVDRKEFDPPTPRATCAWSIAMAEVIKTMDDEEVLKLMAYNASE